MQNTKVGDAAVLIIFCVFIISVFTAMVLGVGVYQNVNLMSRTGYDERVGLSYIWTKVKNGEAEGKVYIGDFHGIPALFVDEEISGQVFRTAIYHHDGWIHELFYSAEDDFAPSDGIPVLRAQSLKLGQKANGLIDISIGEESLLINPKNINVFWRESG